MNKNEKLGFLNIDTSLYQTRISNKFQNRKPYKPADPRTILEFHSGYCSGDLYRDQDRM